MRNSITMQVVMAQQKELRAARAKKIVECTATRKVLIEKRIVVNWSDVQKSAQKLLNVYGRHTHNI